MTREEIEKLFSEENAIDNIYHAHLKELQAMESALLIQSRLIKQRGDDLASAIILVVKLLPIAAGRATMDLKEARIIKEAQDFLAKEG